MILKIDKVFPLVAREYTDRDGRKQVFKSKGFVLRDDRNYYYAEAVQEWAEHWENNPIKEGTTVKTTLKCNARQYKDAQGVVRYSNEISIANIMKV